MVEEGSYSELLKIIEEAIQREILAAKLYEENAGKANNAKARELLLQLAKEEKHHREMLRLQYEELSGHALYDESGS